MSRIYKIYLFVLLVILLFPFLAHCQVIDGGRGRACLALRESISGTFGTSLEFPKFSPDCALWSFFGEFGMNFSIKDSTELDEKKEYLGLAGWQLWFFLHSKFYTEIRVSLNVPDLFRQDQKVGWIMEGGILIPFSNRFCFTFNAGKGTAFSIDRNLHTHFSLGIIDREFLSLFSFPLKKI